MDSQTILASHTSLIERLERIPDLLTMRLLETEEKRRIFFRKFASVGDFAADRCIDLTATIKDERPSRSRTFDEVFL
jgi:hypothetical protein